jgi:hypothetical protein
MTLDCRLIDDRVVDLGEMAEKRISAWPAIYSWIMHVNYKEL